MKESHEYPGQGQKGRRGSRGAGGRANQGQGQGGGRERRQPGARRVPGDRPSQRGAAAQRARAAAPRTRDAERADEAEEVIAREIVRELLEQMGFCHGIENYSRHFSKREPGEPPPVLIDYFAARSGCSARPATALGKRSPR